MRFPLHERRNEADAAAYLGKKPGVLRNWRMTGRGPRFYRSGRAIFYMLEDLDSYIVEGSERAA